MNLLVLALAIIISVIAALSHAGDIAAAPTTVTYPPTTPAPPRSKPLTPAQKAALDQLYESTDGPNWVKNDGWTNETCYQDVCFLVFGVVCDGYGNIYQFALPGNKMKGAMPTFDGFFQHFPMLKVVVMTNNMGLTGGIPAFPSWHPLVTLEVGSCSLTGTIPTSIFSSGNLMHFDCSNNKIKGQIPPEVGDASALSTFVVGTNQLRGSLPDTICRLFSLTQLDISDNYIQSIPGECIGGMGNLQILNLAKNWLQMQFPASWCNLRFLQQLFLQDNAGFYGEIPKACTWPQLTHLVIELTQMSGPFPVQVFGMKQMYALILSLSKFDGEVPDRFDELPHLAEIALNGNGPNYQYTWRGPIPRTLFSHVMIQGITIQYTHFTGIFPRFSTSMFNLSHVTMASNIKLTSSGHDFPVEVFNIWRRPTQVGLQRTLYIPNNNLGGVLPELDVKVNPIYNISMAKDSIHFSQNNWIGYIPLSLLDWVPEPSQKDMLVDCNLLFAPIAPELLHLVNVKVGFQWSLVSTAPSSIPRHHGFKAMTVHQARTGELCVFDSYHDIFEYRCSFCYADTFEKQTQNAWCSNFSNIQANTTAYVNATTCSFECEVPAHGTLRRGANQVRLLYHGASDEGLSRPWWQDMTNRGTMIQLYEDEPPIVNMTPNEGRWEGCTRVTVYGKYMSNLPAPMLVIAPRASLDVANYSQPYSIQTQRGNIKSDTEIEFVVPFAVHGNMTDIYVNQTNLSSSLLVSLFPAGVNMDDSPDVVVTKTPLRDDLNYSFHHAHCRTPLVPCKHGHEDPERCPTPVCRCSSNGACMLMNVTLNLTGSSTTVQPSSTVPSNTLADDDAARREETKPQQQQQQQQERESSSMQMRYFLSSSSVAGKGDLAAFDSGARRQQRDGGMMMSAATAGNDDEQQQQQLGYYLLNTTEWECNCDAGFNGSMCQFCEQGYWGPDCQACDCDHGACSEGITGTGECACYNWYWLGARCSMNIIVIVCSILGSVLFIYAAYKVHKSRRKIRAWWYGTCCVVWWTERKEKQARDEEERDQLRKQLLQQDEAIKKGRDEDDRDSRADDFAGYGATLDNTPMNNSKTRFAAANNTPPSTSLPLHGATGSGYSVSRMYEDEDEKRSNTSKRSGRSGGSRSGGGGGRMSPTQEDNEDVMAIADAVSKSVGRLGGGYLDSSDDD